MWVQRSCYILGILVLFCGLIYICVKWKREHFQSSITLPTILFLSNEMASDFMRHDDDHACKGLSDVNLHAIGVKSHEECMNKWMNSCLSFNDREKERINDAVLLVEQAIDKNIVDKKFKKQLKGLPWQFGKTMHPYYLDGLPHTRGDVIWLTDKLLAQYDVQRLAQLLMHERTHIWQRRYPKYMKQWMDAQGYTFFMKRSDYSANHVIRFNPDLDDSLYLDPNGKLMITTYKSMTPFNLLDVQYSTDNKGEHPNETMAYAMETLISS